MNNRTILTVAPRKPLNLNQSVKSPNNLMCVSLNGQPIAEKQEGGTAFLPRLKSWVSCLKFYDNYFQG